MKKLVIISVILVTVFLASIYIFIPGRLNIQKTISMKAPLPAVFRSLLQDSNWQKWWLGSEPFIFHEKKFIPRKKIFSALDMDIISGKDSFPARMNLVLVETDSMLVTWDAELISGDNLFKRLSQNRKAKSLMRDLDSILVAMKNFFEHKENIYGFPVRETIVKDSVLITTRRSFTHKPGVQEIDNMIQQLKKYIAANKAVEKNYPMLNVVKMSETEYETQVAIPVDRRLPETNDFVPKFLLKGGKILEAEITGGLFTVENAFHEFENYRADLQFSTPAIPFQLLVTDRAKETDTTKWITRLYYPVF